MGVTGVHPPRGYGTEAVGPHAGRRGMDRLATPLGSGANPPMHPRPRADRPDMPDLPKLRAAPADKDHGSLATITPRPALIGVRVGRGVFLRPAGRHLSLPSPARPGKLSGLAKTSRRRGWCRGRV